MVDEKTEAHARNLLNNPVFNEAFDVLRKDLTNRWESSGSREVEARESIWLAMRLLDRVHAHITSIVETGRMAEILDKQHPFI
jgi:hypothetical protein